MYLILFCIKINASILSKLHITNCILQSKFEKQNYFRSDDLGVKVEELTQRLENQTAEVLRLTLELEEYEYKDYGTTNTRSNSNTLQNDEGDSDYEYVDDEDEEHGKDPW